MAPTWLKRVAQTEFSGHFEPKRWEFWRCLLICFCLFTLVGHWLEIPYCSFMNMFDIVEEDYDVWTDPWYHPYWVYGIGAVVMTLLIEPFKERIIRRRKTLWGALLEFYVFAVILSMLMELIIGLIISQPDEFGNYPFWDNSQLPLNVFGQAWLVNDMVIGFMAVLYLWLFYPLIHRGLDALRPPVANAIFVIVVVGFAACCVASYWHEWVIFFGW